MKKSERLSSINSEKAYQALLNKESQTAYKLASRAAWLNPRNEAAWLILATVSPPEKSIRYLRKAMALNPDNPKTMAGMDWAIAKQEKSRAGNELDQIKQVLNNGCEYPAVDDIHNNNKHRLFKRAFSRWQSIVAISFILMILLLAIFAPILAPVGNLDDSPYFKIICERLSCVPEPPSKAYPLGTIMEYDVLHTLIWGVRQALVFGLTAAGLTAVIGTTFGAIGAYTGGWLDSIIMRVCDGFLAFPIIAAVAMFSQVIAFLTPESWGLSLAQFEAIPQELNFFQNIIVNSDPVLLALILFSWMPYTRVIHAQVLQVKKTEYVEAARVLGVRKGRIIFRHILPNSISPAIVMLTRDIGRMVVLQASLTYIGISDSSAWASLLTLGKDWIIGPGGNLLTRWWIYLPITLAVVVFGVSWNLLGDEVNIWLNPRQTLLGFREKKTMG